MSVIYLTLALILNRKVFTASPGVDASHLGNHGSATGESVVQSPWGRQHMILKKFPENCKRLRKIWVVGGRSLRSATGYLFR